MHVKNARLSFPYLFSANAFDENQKAKYSATFLLPEDDPQLDAIKQEISKVATEKWGQKGGWPDGGRRSMAECAGPVGVLLSN